MYLDSAIIVKLLVREPDSDWFDRRLRGESFESSELALTEVPSALLAKERAASISARERAAATEKFHGMVDDETFTLFKMNHAVLARAAGLLVACHPQIPLRTLDALHVATAILHNCLKLSTTDHRMRSACERFAIPLVPAALDELLKA